MQPTRDSEDTRYWTQAEGGKGFSRNASPRYQYSAIGPKADRVDMTLPSMDDVTIEPVTLRHYEPETVRSRARATLMLAIDRMTTALEDDDNALNMNELAQSVNALGKISGVASVEVSGDRNVSIRVIDEREPLPVSRATARITAPDSPDTAHALPNEVDIALNAS